MAENTGSAPAGPGSGAGPSGPGPSGPGKPPLDAYESLDATVKQVVRDGQKTVKARIVKDLAKEELDRRKDLVVKGLKRYAELKKELQIASKPDNASFDENGKQIGNFTKAGLDKKNKALKAFEKFKKILDQALKDDNPNYDPLSKVLSGKISLEKDEPKDGEEEKSED